MQCMPDYEQEEVTASKETREINATLDWYAVTGVSSPKSGSKITPLYCGEHVFREIEAAIKNATQSINLVFWRMDETTRLTSNSTKTIRQLLEEKSQQGVKVKLLLNKLTNPDYWYENIGRLSPEGYQIIEDHKRAFPNIETVYRGFSGFDRDKMTEMLEQQGIKEWTDQELVLTKGATHHQKMVLIDSEDADKAKAFVLGLNMSPEYRDTLDHYYDYNPDAPKINWQDLGCMAEGPIMLSIYYHFITAWSRETDKNLSEIPQIEYTPKGTHSPQFCCTQFQETKFAILESYKKAIGNAHNYIYIENQYFRYPEIAELIKKRAIELRAVAQANEIKTEELYLFVIMNYGLEKLPIIKTDINAMNTYATLASLGQQQLMPGIQQSLSNYDPDAWFKSVYISQEEKDTILTPEDQKHIESVDDIKDLTDPKKYDIDGQNGQKPFELHDIPGLKVIIGTLNTDSTKRQNSNGHSATKVDYRGITVHSKLLIVDDLFTSVGSANINVRSFFTDSEANISIPDNQLAYEMRSKLWKANTTKSIDNAELTSSAAIKCDAKRNFKHWNNTMNENWKRKQQGNSLIGHLVRFWDDTSTDLYIYD